MTTSIFIAKLFAITYLAIGLGILFNPKYYYKVMKEMVKDKGTMYLGGIMALIAGFLIVNYHNVWESSWTILITIFGCLALLKGVFLLVFPEWFMDFSYSILKKEKILPFIGFFVLVIGGVFGYFGFLA